MRLNPVIRMMRYIKMGQELWTAALVLSKILLIDVLSGRIRLIRSL
jgi:hypothetical protein